MLEREISSQAEQTLPKIINNYSTSQLIPSSRREALRVKRDVLKRKINQVADELFKLKYDTQYQCQELEKLNQTVQNICLLVQNNRELVKKEIEETVKPVFKEISSDQSQNSGSNFKKKSDISTQLSAFSEQYSNTSQEKETKIQMLHFKESINSNKDWQNNNIFSNRESCTEKKSSVRMYQSQKILPRRQNSGKTQTIKKDTIINQTINKNILINSGLLFLGLLAILILLL